MIQKRITLALDVGLIQQLTDAAAEIRVSRNALIERMIQDANWSEIAEDMKEEGR